MPAYSNNTYENKKVTMIRGFVLFQALKFCYDTIWFVFNAFGNSVFAFFDDLSSSDKKKKKKKKKHYTQNYQK